MHSWRWEVIWEKGLNVRKDSRRSREAYGEARQVAGGGLQVSRRGGGRHRWAQCCCMPGGGGWAGLVSLGRRRQSWAVSSAPAGPDAGARVRGRWVGIQSRDSPP